jgi:hypothetical protein
MIKNKHKWGNNISNRAKFMINSPEVHFNITRWYPEVGLKNNYILSYKNHLGLVWEMEESSGWKRIEGDFRKFWLIIEIPPPQYPSFPFIPLIPKQALKCETNWQTYISRIVLCFDKKRRKSLSLQLYLGCNVPFWQINQWTNCSWQTNQTPFWPFVMVPGRDQVQHCVRAPI